VCYKKGDKQLGESWRAEPTTYSWADERIEHFYDEAVGLYGKEYDALAELITKGTGGRRYIVLFDKEKKDTMPYYGTWVALWGPRTYNRLDGLVLEDAVLRSKTITVNWVDKSRFMYVGPGTIVRLYSDVYCENLVGEFKGGNQVDLGKVSFKSMVLELDKN